MVFRSQKAHQSMPGVVPLLLIKNRRSIPAAETGRDFGLRRLRNLNSKISPKGRKQELQTALFCSINNGNAAFFYSNRQGETSTPPGLQCMTTTTPTSTSSSSGSGKSLSAAFWMNRKNSLEPLERSKRGH